MGGGETPKVDVQYGIVIRTQLVIFLVWGALPGFVLAAFSTLSVTYKQLNSFCVGNLIKPCYTIKAISLLIESETIVCLYGLEA